MPLALRVWPDSPARRGGGSPAALLGQLVHDVLDRAVSSGLLVGPDWEERLKALWLDASQELAERHPGKPTEAWPGYHLKRALLKYVAAAIRGLTTDLPPDASILTEPQLKSSDGMLEGTPDLVLRSRDLTRIIDYKTGKAVEEQSGEPRPSYARQLQLYSYLEHQTSRRWPDSAHLFPLDQDPVEISIVAGQCIELADEARTALTNHNLLVGTSPPSNCCPQTCRFCSFAVLCPDFWSACDTSWAEKGVLAAAGQVARLIRTPLGGTTMQVSASAGTLGETVVTIVNADVSEFPLVADIAEDAVLLVVGLSEWHKHPGSYRMNRWTRVAFEPR